MTGGTTANSAAAGVSYLIFVQVLSRGFTFGLNQVLLRFLSPERLGVAAQLELYSISVLYFSRESIRVAVQRQVSGTQTVVNLSYVAILLGLPISYIVARLYLSTSLSGFPFFKQSLVIYGVSCLVELFSEPAFVTVQQGMLYRIRASAETTATVARCLVSCGVAFWANHRGTDLGVLPFAFGQAAFSVSLLVLYVTFLKTSITPTTYTLLPSRIKTGEGDAAPYLGYFSRPLTKLSMSLTLQSAVKYVLTQADAILIASLASLSDQGAYALASNYGGLIARMLFQPIEETGRNLFAKLCNRHADQKGSPKGPDGKATAGEESEKVSNANVKQAATVLAAILHLYGVISLLAVSLGPHLAPLLLQLVAGRRWTATGAGQVLSAYCFYIPLLAVNGIIEAFISAVATNSELYSQSIWMGGFSVGFASAAWIFLSAWKMGAVGLVLANCVNMLLRILWGANFIQQYFEHNRIDFAFMTVLPHGWSTAVALGAYSLLRSQSESTMSGGILYQLLKSGLVAVSTLGFLVYFEQETFKKGYRTLRPRR